MTPANASRDVTKADELRHCPDDQQSAIPGYLGMESAIVQIPNE